MNDYYLAIKLLNAVKITTTHCEIIKAATVNFTYEFVKETIIRTFKSFPKITEKEIKQNVNQSSVPPYSENQSSDGH